MAIFEQHRTVVIVSGNLPDALREAADALEGVDGDLLDVEVTPSGQLRFTMVPSDEDDRFAAALDA